MKRGPVTPEWTRVIITVTVIAFVLVAALCPGHCSNEADESPDFCVKMVASFLLIVLPGPLLIGWFRDRFVLSLSPAPVAAFYRPPRFPSS